MFRRDPKGRFIYTDVGFLWKKRQYRFESGRLKTIEPMDEAQYQTLLTSQQEMPVPVMHDDSTRKRWWTYRNDFYCEDEGLSPADIKTLILDRAGQSRKRVERAMARLGAAASATSARRELISDEVKTLVWQRDRGRCVECGSHEKLEFDHIIPITKGGGNSARNLQLLCEACNRPKGGNLV